MAVVCYQRLMDFLDDVDRKRIEDQKLPRTLSSHLALRGRKYDKMTTNFLSRHPDGMIVSLGSGFDTRYFRMNLNPSQYLELDLPEVVELKKELIGDAMDYRMIGKSVLDYTWIDDITDTTGKEVLFIMEGLLMYLDEKDVRTLIDRICGSFSQSEMIIELINKKYTQGLYRKMAVRKMKKSAGSDAGEAMNFGLSDGKDIEAFNSKLKLLGNGLILKILTSSRSFLVCSEISVCSADPSGPFMWGLSKDEGELYEY